MGSLFYGITMLQEKKKRILENQTTQRIVFSFHVLNILGPENALYLTDILQLKTNVVRQVCTRKRKKAIVVVRKCRHQNMFSMHKENFLVNTFTNYNIWDICIFFCVYNQ